MTKNSDIDYEAMINKNYPNNYSSAREIVPDIVSIFKPKTVVDVGCGAGVWLKVFEDNDVEVHGLDGEWIRNIKTLIGQDKIEIRDLEKIKPSENEKYDLAVSLEVAEHISAKNADNFVNYLTSVANTIFFSAATPNSGGQHHVNEKWQSYWISKFKKRGYVAVDYIRPRYWNNKMVAYCYAQESFIFIKKELLDNYSELKIYALQERMISDIVHPELFSNQIVKYTHEWNYLFSIQKKLFRAYFEKFRREILKR